MKSNKVILFDWGGVIEHAPQSDKRVFSYQDLYSEALVTIFPQLTDIPYTKIFAEFYKGSRENVIVGYGRYMQFISERLRICNLDAEQAQLFMDTVMSISDKVSFNQKVVNYIYSLRSQCTVGILSDLCVIDVPRIKAQIKQNKIDKYYLSCEIAKSKHHNTIFDFVQKDLGVSPYNILFFDDKGDNVDKAKANGWNAERVTAFDLPYIMEVCNDFLSDEFE